MSFLKYLMFPSARRRAERRERRHACRNAENAIESVKARQCEMEREAKKRWAEAREALKNGEKSASQRALISYRALQTMIIKLEQKRWVFEQYYTKLQVAQSDIQFSYALASLTKVMNIDPEKVQDVFEAANDVLDEQVETDKFWDKMYDKEANGAVTSLDEYVPSMDDLSATLEQEVAADLGGDARPIAAGEKIDARISAGQDRVKNILEGK